MMLTDERADACIVMEPTDCRPVTCARGALWFRVTCKGRSAHSGQPGRGINALNLARRAMDAMEKYHADLLDRSRSSESLGVALFEEFENPMPLTFGCCRAGNWPATSPALAVFEGVLGFLPNRTREEVMHELRQALADSIGSALSDYVDIDFNLQARATRHRSTTSTGDTVPGMLPCRKWTIAARGCHERLLRCVGSIAIK